MNSVHASRSVAVCWSGGWDSTFRVLDLVVHYGCTVQPVYIVDPNRRSLKHEIAAMDRVRMGIAELFPDRAALLLDTLYIQADELEIPEINRQRYQKIIDERQLTAQYLWMSVVGGLTGHQHVEVMLQGSERGTEFLRAHSREARLPCGAPTHFLIDWEATNSYNEGRKLFRSFALPTINTLKPEMEDIAREYGFDQLLHHAWSCHFPLGDEACGMCFTCRHVMYDGLPSLFTEAAMRRNRVWFLVHPLRVLLLEPRRSLKRIWDLARWRRVQLRNAITARMR